MTSKKYTQSANYLLIGKNEKPQTKVEYEKISEVSEIILDILKTDYDFWKSCKQKQQGVEKFNLLSKVSAKISINSNVFYMALDELEGQQKVIPEIKDGKIRYSLFLITN